MGGDSGEAKVEIRSKRIKYGKKKSVHTFRPSLPPSCSCRHRLVPRWYRNDISFKCGLYLTRWKTSDEIFSGRISRRFRWMCGPGRHASAS